MNQWLIKFLPGVLLGWVLKTLADQLQWGESDDSSDEGAAPLQGRRRRAGRTPPPGEELKMVLCINEELMMGKGKIGRSVGRAGSAWQA